VRNKSGTLSAQPEAPGALKGTTTIAFTCLKSWTPPPFFSHFLFTLTDKMKSNSILATLVLIAPITAQHVLPAVDVPFSPELERYKCNTDTPVVNYCVVSLSVLF
jgi:hypothetical protein